MYCIEVGAGDPFVRGAGDHRRSRDDDGLAAAADCRRVIKHRLAREATIVETSLLKLCLNQETLKNDGFTRMRGVAGNG